MSSIIKYMIVLVLLSMTLAGHAQWYSFIESKSDYHELDNSATIGHILNENYILTDLSIPIGFRFKFHDKYFDSLYIQKIVINYLFFYFKDSADYSNNEYDNFIRIIPWAYFQGGINGLNLQSNLPLTYKYQTTGTIGNRVFKFEWQDIKFYKREMNCGTHPFLPCVVDSSVFYYCNLQLWLFENNGDIEIHFGKSFFPANRINTSLEITKSHLLMTNLYGSTDNIQKNYGIGKGLDGPSLSGWPRYNSVYKFYLNNANQVFLNDYSTLSLDNNLVFPGLGSITGQNILLDYEWAEKYYVPVPILIKGIICQNYGITTSNDSATFGIYSVGKDGLPAVLIYQTKRPYSCLKLDKGQNYISFDSMITVKDSFFVSFGIKPYDNLKEDTIGLCYANLYTDSYFPLINAYGRTAVRGFNHKWYDVYSIGYLSDWISDFTRNNDLLHFAMAAVINFNLGNQSVIHDSLNCSQISTVDNIHWKQKISVFPVPAKDIIAVDFYLNETTDVSLVILTNVGIISEEYKLPVSYDGNYHTEIDISKYLNGLYILFIKSKNQNLYGKFVIQK